MQVMQGVDAHATRYWQTVLGRLFQVSGDYAHQGLWIEPLQGRLLFGAELGTIAWPDIQLRSDREQAGSAGGGVQLDPLAPGFEHFGQSSDLALAQLIAA
ncbi:hypothetical protein D3C84_831070 [compost metagenome]